MITLQYIRIVLHFQSSYHNCWYKRKDERCAVVHRVHQWNLTLLDLVLIS